MLIGVVAKTECNVLEPAECLLFDTTLLAERDILTANEFVELDSVVRWLALTVCCKDKEGDLVFDPFTGSGTTAVAAKELNRAFVGAELEEEFAGLAARRVAAIERGSLLRAISEQYWTET